MTSTPRPGDRVRVVVEGTVGPHGKQLLWDDGGAISMRRAQSVEVTIPAPVEQWQPGDVVRADGDPEDGRLWAYVPDLSNSDLWVGCFGYERRYYNRASLPPNLTLIVRDGRPVLPEPTGEDLDAAAEIYAGETDYRRADWRAAIKTLDSRRGVFQDTGDAALRGES